MIDERIDEIKNKFEDFIDRDLKDDPDTYSDKITDLVSNNQIRLIIKTFHLRNDDSINFEDFLKNPKDWIIGFEEKMNEHIQRENRDGLDGLKQALGVTRVRFHVGISGPLGSHFLSPRNLLSRYLNNLVCVEGIVTRVTLISPRIVHSIHHAKVENEDKFQEQNYRDENSFLGAPTTNVFPKFFKHDAKIPLTVEYGFCSYKDTQRIFLQEMPENAPAGQLPRSVEVYMEDDLVDSHKPGDRVKVFGVFKTMPLRRETVKTNGIVKSSIYANNIEHASELEKPTSGKDIRKIREVNKEFKGNLISYLAKSIAPSIYGHDDIKKALILCLVGGEEKKLKNNIRLRGDVHLLLVGDPGTAKSQILRFAMNMAPISISTTGRASTGVGLTAAVVRDDDTGENTLAAGAMVLGDRGIVCVDEFDKMNEHDRASMHEVMEQQTVTIQKAGVHSTLNARCSIVAAANPICGSYNPKISVQKNIGLPESLLSRFDLVFIVLDEMSEELDLKISNHVLRLHQFFEKGESFHFVKVKKQDSDDEDSDSDSDDDDDEIFMKMRSQKKEDSEEEVLSVEFLRKYIKYTKRMIHPSLTDDSINKIKEKYCLLREKSKEFENTLPITPRSLESLIRLTTAHAKLRLSKIIEDEDIEIVYNLIDRTLFFKSRIEGNISNKNTIKKKKNLKRKRIVDSDSDENEDDLIEEVKDDDDGDIKMKEKYKTEEEDIFDDEDKDEIMKEKDSSEGNVEIIKNCLEKKIRSDEMTKLDEFLGYINDRLTTKIDVGDLEKVIQDNGLEYFVNIKTNVILYV